MFDIPAPYRNLNPDDYFLNRKPVFSAVGLDSPHHYEVFLSHPGFPLHGVKRKPVGGAVIAESEKQNNTQWFDWQCLRSTLQELEANGYLHLSTNVAPCSAADKGFVRNMEMLLRQIPQIAGRLEFELTERNEDIKDSELLPFIDAAHNVGARVVLDDIGHGRYRLGSISSSLLAACDGIKIASDLVANPRKGRPLLGQLVTSVRERGKTVTLEGAYAGVMKGWLRENMGFDYVQPLQKSQSGAMNSALKNVLKSRISLV